MGLEPLLERCLAQLLQPADLPLSEPLVDELGERRPPPERERLLQGGERRLRRSAGKLLPRLLDQPLEADGIDEIGVGAEQVARRPREERLPPDELPQLRDVDLEGVQSAAGG